MDEINRKEGKMSLNLYAKHAFNYIYFGETVNT
jgi:hypothetical protein